MIVWCSRTLIHSPYLALCTTEKAFHNLCKKLKVPKDRTPKWLGEGGHASTHQFSRGDRDVYVVCMPTKHPRGIELAQQYCLLVHEAVHIWQGFREGIGEKAPSSEFEAYSIQSLAQTLIAAYIEAKKR